ncbi:filamentous hemagglutinin family protein [Enterobacter sp. BIGb0383]|uniref:two-partner secretion domain-containing protein n=1 Tax=unclassified Enterobacter TaxID=2608935 RepID=UPI000F47AFC8|nr:MULTISPECIES: hemagglutinin repeat-containing protein [unclassified Enterobacter]ROP62879.1 filamentous hemagglutinin family protein [Enterobacter sp. BIGb0383]ROS13040.1 filamentous hemagglutinin family protein [Enterobacter sp. BIGb0359]
MNIKKHHRLKTKHAPLAILLYSILPGQTVLCYAGESIQVAAGNTQINQTPGGVPVINIAPPNQAGISHNQYHQFNVEQQGAILNNAAGQSAQTRLAGSIAANPHLAAGNAASGIVNEVVSGNRSQLKGYLEVAGTAASVVVANPYGITCNGCGFINTPRVVLTTGKPEWGQNGELQALEVKQGTILLEGKGLDASQSDKLALIARAAELNAQLNGKDTTVILGSNRVTADRQIIPLETAEGDIQVAIDTGALGGMYSHRIRLVASEKGVGVNLANLVASQGNIELKSNGQLVLNNAAAKADLRVQSDDIRLQGNHQAGGDIQLSGESLQVENAQVQSGNDLTIHASLSSENSTYQSGNDIIINGDLNAEKSHFSARKNITIGPKSDEERNSVVVSGGKLTTEQGDINIHGGYFSLYSDSDDAIPPEIKAGRHIAIQADDITIKDRVNWTENDPEPDTWTAKWIRPRLSGQGNIALTANDNMRIRHVQMDAGGNVSFRANNFDSAGEGYHGSSGDRGTSGFYEDYYVGYSDIKSGGSLDFTFGDYAVLYSTNIEAKESININAAGMLALSGNSDFYTSDIMTRYQFHGANFTGRDLAINAEELYITGGKFNADNTLSFSSARDMTLNGISRYYGDDANKEYYERWFPTELSAGGALWLNASGNLNATAVKLSATGDVKLYATEGISLVSENDTKNHKYLDSTQHWIENGITLVTSARDIILDAGADIITHASTLIAGRDITLASTKAIHLNTVQAEDYKRSSDYTQQQEEHYIRQASTELTSARNISLTSGGSLSLQAAKLEAKGSIGLASGENIHLESATESDYYFYEKNTASSNILSSTRQQTLYEDYATLEKGTLLSADTLSVYAANDLKMTGSALIGDSALLINAVNDVSLAAADEEFSSIRIENVSKSGIFSGGTFGFTIGKKSSRHKVEENGITQSQSLSTLGSTAGDVTINAGGQAELTGADMIAARKLALFARNIQIQPGRDDLQRYERLEHSVRGLTFALSGTLVNAITSALNTVHSVREAGLNRVSALRGLQTILSGVQVAQSAAANASEPAASMVGISASLGQQKSVMERRDTSSIVNRSEISSGDETWIVADNNLLIAGSRLTAGGDIALEAGHHLLLAAAASTHKNSSKNSSSGGSVGISFGLGQSSGFSVTAGANYSKGKENGSTTEMIETLVNSGNQVELRAGKDIALIGAQVSGDKVVVRAGNRLSMTSLQDSDSYEAKQDSISGNMSVAVFGAGGSASLSASSQRINSDYLSVVEQTGIYAGSAGFDIEVQGHSWLDGAVIASRAGTEDNRLLTKTLGWRDILNSASYETQQSAIGAGTGGGGGSVGGGSDQASSWTRAALSPALLTITAPETQLQAIATLSQDVANANQQLSPIFDLEKEQKRLQTLQLIGEIGAQIGDIARTQGDINGLNAAKEKYPGLSPDALRKTDIYLAEIQKFGTGSAIQQGIQAATAAIQGLAGGNIAQAASGAAAPYLAEVIKQYAPDEASRVIAHAAVAGVIAAAQGNTAAAGAAGAATTALMGEAIKKALYGDVPVSQLSEEQKQTLVALGSLAAGLAGGLTGDNPGDALAGAQAGQNEISNNMASMGMLQRMLALELLNSAAIAEAGEGGANEQAALALTKAVKKGLSAACLENPSCVIMAVVMAQQNGDSASSNAGPNAGANLTDTEKAELGGAGSGTPGGWEPQDEENERNSETVKQQKEHFDELSKLYDKSNASQNLNIDGQTIRQGEVSNNYGTTKVFESQNLTDQQIYKYAQQLAGETPLKEVRSGIYTSKLSDGSVLTLRNVSTSEAQTGARWTIDIRNSRKLTELGNKYSRVEIKFK